MKTVYYVMLTIQEHLVDENGDTVNYQLDENPYYFPDNFADRTKAEEYASEIVNAHEEKQENTPPPIPCTNCNNPLEGDATIISGLPYCSDCARFK